MNLIKRLFLSSVAALALASCCPEPPAPPENLAPDTAITREFIYPGQITYLFSGTDEDGSINFIESWFNDSGNYEVFGNNSRFSIPIFEGRNSVVAIAYDNEDLADTTPATDFFISPSDEVANDLVHLILTEKRDSYYSIAPGKLMTLGPTAPSFYVDYCIKTFGGIDAVVNYVGYGESLENELSNKGFLDSYGIPNLYLARTTSEHIRLQMETFIQEL